MKKVLLVLGLMVALTLIGPGQPKAEVDSTKIFIYSTGFVVIPVDDGAPKYDVHLGWQFGGHYKVGKNVSIGGIYKNWKQKAETATMDLTGEFKGGVLTYWVNEYGSKFNLGFMGGIGQAKVRTEEGTDGDKTEIFGMILKYQFFENINFVGALQIGSFGDTDKDALMINLGIGAPISF